MTSGHSQINHYTYRSSRSAQHHSRPPCSAVDYIGASSIRNLDQESINGINQLYGTKRGDHHRHQIYSIDHNHLPPPPPPKTSDSKCSNHTRTWKIVPLVSSFLAFVYIYLQYHNVNRQIDLLRYISTNWFTAETGAAEDKFQLKSVISEFIVIKEDIDHLVSQLWISRTTLLLTLVFIAVYIIAWTILLIFLTNKKIEPWRAMISMIIFASIDIAASGGFVLIRLVTYAMRNNDDQYKALPKHGPIEKNELIGLASLRLSLFQSSSGSTDIMVSFVIASISFLRLYSIYTLLLVFNRRNKAQSNGSLSSNCDDRSIQEKSDDQLTVKINDEQLGTYRSAKEMIDTFSPSSASSVFNELNDSDIIVDAAEMPAQMQKVAIQVILEAANIYREEKLIAECLKRKFDEKYEPTWHCVVGRNWGSCVTHSKHCYIRLTVKNLTILLYRSS